MQIRELVCQDYFQQGWLTFEHVSGTENIADLGRKKRLTLQVLEKLRGPSGLNSIVGTGLTSMKLAGATTDRPEPEPANFDEDLLNLFLLCLGMVLGACLMYCTQWVASRRPTVPLEWVLMKNWHLQRLRTWKKLRLLHRRCLPSRRGGHQNRQRTTLRTLGNPSGAQEPITFLDGAST